MNKELFNDELFNRVLDKAKSVKKYQIGYPINEGFDLKEFYEWYDEHNLSDVFLNNVGDPNNEKSVNFGTLYVERKIIRTIAPIYGFDENEVWGLMTESGSDGNNHGIYYGRNYLESITKKKPILYVSSESHYSNKRLAELQQIEVKLIPTDELGKMIPEEFRKALDSTRPALVVFSMGTTFKGGIDDMQTIKKIVEEVNPPAAYYHVDAALFGGYLAFSDYSNEVNKKICGYDSISVSGHKFFGCDEPCGLFFTTKEIIDYQNPNNVPYLIGSVPTILCSRSAISPLKIYYTLKRYGVEGLRKQVKQMFENVVYLKNKLDEIGWPSWISCKESNIVFFKKIDDALMKKYFLARATDDRFGGELGHIVVMQGVTKEIIDEFIADIKENCLKG
ncbi:MAG: aminotransferase class V-fold PLP-dependent enzyme [Lachnospiraceae bacterium]|nr:aminotransferase class V-fold PLP-dependent enzyme [Lachnospiraceae bacterium]